MRTTRRPSAGISGASLSGDDPGPRPGPGARGALVLLRAYKVLLSPLFAGSCRFIPSCSDYAAEAIRRHGLAKGVWLAAKRLGRCHPFCEAGYDPVPEASAPVRRTADRIA